METAIENCAQDTGFSGVMRVAGPSGLSFSGSWGYRDRAEGLRTEADTRFAIASGTKLFTALGIGRLVEQEALRLDSPVGSLHPDFHSWVGFDSRVYPERGLILSILSNQSDGEEDIRRVLLAELATRP